MKTHNKFYWIIVFFIFSSLNLWAQLSTKHYIPPVFGREDLGCHYLVLSTPSSVPFDVTIKDGSGNYITTQNISSFNSSTYYLGCDYSTGLLVLESELNTPLTGKGFILEASEPFYVNLRIIAGPQAGSLTSKGAEASLGTEFRAGFMFNNDGQDWRKSNTIGILATEDNTQVYITDIRQGVVFEGTTPTGLPLTSSDYNITLNQGESFVIAAFVDNPDATENTNGMNGIHVSSTKPIAMSTATWLGGNALQGGSPGTGRDLGIDEIVPYEHVGNEYVIIKGEGIDNERVIVVPTVDGTELFLNGNTSPIATIDAGDYYVIDNTQFSSNDNLYFETNYDVYVYQMANGGNGATDDNERQNGLNFIPPVGCSGGKSVFLPDVDFIGEAQINIIADAGATVYVDGTNVGSGDVITGTSNYVTYKLNNNYSGDVVVTSDKLIRVSLVNLNGNIGAAGYFSGFTKDIAISTQSINSDNIAKEGCVNGSFNLFIGTPSSTDTEIDFTIAGTATNGIDYEFIDNSVVIPAGQTSASITIEAIQDGISEGQESIMLIYEPEICAGLDTAYLYIDDADPIQFTIVPTDLSCYNDNSGEIYFDATGGTLPYNFYVEDESNVVINSTNNPVTGLAAGTYTVQVYDVYGCKAEAVVVGGQFDAGTTFLPDGSGVTYTSVLPISGFGVGETITDLSQVQQICANMEHSYMGDLSIRIIAPSGESVMLKNFPGGGATDLGEPVATGQVDGSAGSTMTDPGNGFDYCFNDAPNYGTMNSEAGNYSHTYIDNLGHNLTDSYLPAGAYTSDQPFSNLLGATKNGNWTIEVIDHYGLDNGYIFYWSISLLGEYPDTIAYISEPAGMNISGSIAQSSCGESNGAINLTVSGAISPYSFQWSNGATSEDIGGIPSGSYTVTVTDGNGCSQQETFLLNSNSSLSGTAISTNSICFGGNSGAIDLTVTGGSSPYTYYWETGATTEDVSSLSAGAYIVTITDSEGCQRVESFSVAQNPQISLSQQIINNEICGTSNGSINIECTGGSGSYGYNWSNGSHTQDISSISGGDYYLTITDAYGCQVSFDFLVQNNVSNCTNYCYTNLTATITDDQCGSAQGAINLSVNDATTPYNVQWSNGATTEDISNLEAGIYTITVNDAANCEVIESYIVGNNTGGLSISNIQTTNELCGNSNGAIDITVVGGILPYTYYWDNGATNEDISGLSEGTYTLELTDANNCSLTENITITNNTGTLSATAILTHEICNNNSGSINQTVTGNNGALSYIWNQGSSQQDISGLSEGTYTCSIYDASGCELIKNYTINNLSGNIAIVNSNIDNETCNQNNGQIDIVVSGGDGNYNYLWNNGATTEDLTDLNEGSYNLTVTDGNGCQVSTGSMYVFNTGGNLDIATVSTNEEICSNHLGSIDIEVTGGDGTYTYAWNNGATSQDLFNISAGIYYLTVTDVNGCQQTHSESIINTSGTLNIDNAIVNNEYCGQANGAIDLIISGGTSPINYGWSSGQTTQDIASIGEGNYNCTITDAFGCELIYSQNVLNIATDLSVTHIASAEICSNIEGSIDLTVIGSASPFQFVWNTGATSEDLFNISSGTYSCAITDDNGCTVNTGSIIINNNAGNLTVSSIVADDICEAGVGSINLTASGGTAPYTFAWSNGDSDNNNENLTAGTYSYTVSDVNSCELIGQKTLINTIGDLQIISQSVVNEMCNDATGSVDITVEGGTSPYSFTWSNSATTEDLMGLSAGTYNCTISDVNGCELITNNYNVQNASGDLSVSSSIVTNEICGNGSGTINLTVSGTATPFLFAWSNGDNTEDIINLNEGIYTCTISDINGCSVTISKTVQNTPGNLSIFEDDIQDETCGQSNGSIDVLVLGGNSPYTYLWSNGANTQDISGLSSGIYNLLVNDANGCSQVFSAEIENIGENLTISNQNIVDEICGNHQGSISINVLNGASPYSFVWSNGAHTQNISSLTEGNYNITISDANGCSINQSFTIDNNTGSLSIDGFDISDETCGQANGSIDLSYSGGNEPVTINWSNGNFEEDLEDISAGNFSVTVTDHYGCSLSESGTVQNITGGFAFSNVSFANSLCSDSLGFIDVTVVGGTTPYSFEWSNGESTEDLSNLGPGNYTLTVTDASACQLLVSQSIVNESTGLTIVGAYTGNDYCSLLEGFIDLNISGGILPYSYYWSNGTTSQDLTNISVGDYYCVVTDNSGCMVVSETYTITNTPSSMTAYASSTPQICNTGGSINLTVSDGFEPYSFLWSNTQTTEDISDLISGNYDVTITDATGCVKYFYTTVSQLPNTLNITNAIIDDELCGNAQGSINISVSGGTLPYNYVWDNSSTTQDLSGLSAGDYYLTISDANGCVFPAYFTIENNPGDLNIDTLIAHHINCNNTFGWIDQTYSGGTEPVSINWSNFETEEDPEDLTTGVYTVTITDADGCVDIASTEIFNFDNFIIDNLTIVDDTCTNYFGSIDLTVSGGMPPLSFLWSNGFVTEDIYSLSSDYYQCTITTADGCVLTTGNQFVNNIDGFSFNQYITHSSCSTCPDGAIDLTVIGNGNWYTYYWTGPDGFIASSEDISDLLPGQYNVHVENDLGCDLDTTYTVSFISNILGLSNENTLIVYPNPAKHAFNLKFDLQSEIKYIELQNAIGQVVVKKEIQLKKGNIIFDISGFTPGIYQLKINTEHDFYIEKLIITE
ncbi:MAG: T9SS type A sorting domain-containing protein [Bacteroidales bacterium]|nr:T9SS type A sorting domain-containing protein [Bacteroidales bacterium]